MIRDESQRSSTNTNAQVLFHGATIAKAFDGRKQPVRGLWRRRARFYARLANEDFSTGEQRKRRVSLVNCDGNPVATAAQAIAELNRLRKQRRNDTLPKLGRTPTFAEIGRASCRERVYVLV